MSYIEFIGVTKQYGSGEGAVRALDGMSFTVEKGELCVIAGHSGAGKTTLLNILGGMDRASEGQVLVDGRDITVLSRTALTDYRRMKVGFVFQFYNLIPNLTALENVEFSSELCRSGIRAEDVLARVGLSGRTDHFPAQLSGGEQQRVSIARALAKDPSLLLCDEPTGALDYKTGKAVLKLLQDTCRGTGKTVIIITHNSALTAMADRVIRIRGGKTEENRVNPSPVPVEKIEW